MQWLEAQARKLGVTITSGVMIRHLDELDAPNDSIVINATGLGALSLEPVADPLVEPIRGQVVLVRAPRVRECTMDSSDTTGRGARYIIPRPGSDCEAVLGGCYDVGSWDTTPSSTLAASILRDCLALDPRLSSDGTVQGIEVLSHNVGLRPSRRGGPRLEWESSSPVQLEGGKKSSLRVLHAYGIGPAGYQASWGIAKEVCELVGERVVDSERRVSATTTREATMATTPTTMTTDEVGKQEKKSLSAKL